MSSIGFNICKKSSDLTNSNYVTISAGKGKREDSKVFIDKDTFSYVEGLIWDKHREFGSSRKTKISSEDVKRIVDGIVIAKDKLHSASMDNLQHILKFELYSPAYPISDLVNEMEQYKQFLDQFVECLLTFAQKEKYVLIIRSDG